MEQKIIKNEDFEQFNSANEPNARILIYALQHLGYQNEVAVCDIIDNSIDAGATKIKLIIDNQKIMIIDNGSGMDRETLDEALKLGSDVIRDDNSCLGKFGMGLSTASISIGNRTTVITKQKISKEYLKSSVDVNIIKLTNKFVKFYGDASNEDMQFFDENIKEESGTIVILEDCFGIKNKNMSQFANKMKTEIARVYRKFMDKIEFFVNDCKLQIQDPLWLNDKDTQVFSDEDYEIKWKDKNGNEKNSVINIKMVLLPMFTKTESNQYKINIPNQGFSVLRNSREISFGYMPKWIAKHNRYNRFRGEISFLSEMDDAMGVDFTKNGIDMVESVNDILQQYLKVQISTIGTKAEKESAKIVNSEISHEDAEKNINTKSNILITPKNEKNKKDKNQEINENICRENSEEYNIYAEEKNDKIKVKFVTMSSGRSGNIFSAYLQGKTTVIEWNIDHPFYDRFVLSNKDNRKLVSAVDYLIYSIAVSQLKVLGEDNNKAEIIDQLISIMSNNMRALLG